MNVLSLYQGVPFPKNYQTTVKKILSRLFRVFVHVYIHHFDKLVGLGAVSYCLLYLTVTLGKKTQVNVQQWCINTYVSAQCICTIPKALR